MMRAGRLAGVGFLLTCAMFAAGCLAPRSAPFELPYDKSLATDMIGEPLPVVARSQVPEPSPLLPKLPPPQIPGGKSDLPPLVLPPRNDVLPVNSRPMIPLRVSIRAYVNGKPIFDDEVAQFAERVVARNPNMPQAERSKVYYQFLEKIIEDEVMYQDAVKKLEKINPRTLDKLKTVAGEELEKTLKLYRDNNVPEAWLKERLPTMQKNNERNFIAVEYVRSRVLPITIFTHTQIQDYYDTHLKDFQKEDKVKWQDVVMLLNSKHPTMTDARRFAEDLVAQCRTGDDFLKLLNYDDRDPQFRRGGEGFGERRPDIRPIELAESLFKMRVGQIEVVDVGTTVHIVRVAQREVAGQIPLNDATQKLIRRTLTDNMIQREYQRIVRELKERAVIEYESGN